MDRSIKALEAAGSTPGATVDNSPFEYYLSEMEKKLQMANNMNVTSFQVIEEPIDFLIKESSRTRIVYRESNQVFPTSLIIYNISVGIVTADTVQETKLPTRWNEICRIKRMLKQMMRILIHLQSLIYLICPPGRKFL